MPSDLVLPHPWDEGTECPIIRCVGFEHSHITNPPWIPAFERILILEVIGNGA